MTIGLGTFAFFWRWSSRVRRPLCLADMLQATAEAGAEAFQICDYPAIEEYADGELMALRRQADTLGIALELGTRQVRVERLDRYRHLAQLLGARVVRTMITRDELRAGDPTDSLRTALPSFERAGIAIALETYEQIPTERLVEVVQAVDSPYLGICADPANCVAALEHPSRVMDRIAPYVLNLHVKDFTFTRHEGWVGFNLVGAPLGEGMLDYEHLLATIRPGERGISQIVEHWLPWQGDEEKTCRTEQAWTDHSLEFLRRTQP